MTTKNDFFVFKASWSQSGEFGRVFGNTSVAYDENYAYLVGDTDEPIWRYKLSKEGLQELRGLAADDLVEASSILSEHTISQKLVAQESSEFYSRFYETQLELFEETFDTEEEVEANLQYIRQDWISFMNNLE